MISGEHRLPACQSRQLAETWFQPRRECTEILPAGCRQLRAGSPAPQSEEEKMQLLRAFFERTRLAAQKRERFAGEMEGAGDQDSLARFLRSRDRFRHG